MNKTIIININSIVFHIEEDAYETLRTYMIEIKRHFSQTQSEDSGEILQDIENRIAEMFSERIHQGKKEVISGLDVSEVIAQMGRVSDFAEMQDSEDEVPRGERKDAANTYASFSERKLLRNPDDKVVGGVCSGLGYYLGIQAKWMRIFFVLFFLMGGSGILLYAVLWIVMPLASSRADRMAMRGEEPNLQNFKKNFEEEANTSYSSKEGFSRGSRSHAAPGLSSILGIIGKLIAGAMLIICGATLFGMFILLGFGLLGIFGYHDEILPPLAFLSTAEAVIALFAGVLAISIPFIALFHIFLRILFGIRPMNNYMSLSLWAGWIMAIILIIFYVIVTNRDMNVRGTIKVDKRLSTQEKYYFSENDLSVIEASSIGGDQKRYDLKANGKSFSNYLYSNVDIEFEQVGEQEEPFITYRYSAHGKDRQHATEMASQIDYGTKINKEDIRFDSHFSLAGPSMNRDQRVSVTVYLPIGSLVVINRNLRHKLDGISYDDCADNYAKEKKVSQTEWMMTETGLVCAKQDIVVNKEKEQ